MDRRARPKKGQADAQRPRVRKSPKERGGKVRDLQKRLTEALGKLQTRDHELAEALEQQTATSEVLRVISESQADAQPVFDTIAANALRLCAAAASGVYRFDGELITWRPSSTSIRMGRRPFAGHTPCPRAAAAGYRARS